MATKKDKPTRQAKRQARVSKRSIARTTRVAKKTIRSNKVLDKSKTRAKKRTARISKTMPTGASVTRRSSNIPLTRRGKVLVSRGGVRSKSMYVAPTAAARKVTKKSKRYSIGRPIDNKFLETRKAKKEGPVPVTKTLKRASGDAMYKTKGVSKKRAAKITSRSTKRGYAPRRYVGEGSKPKTAEQALKYQIQRQSTKRAKRTKRNTTRGGSMTLKTHPTRVGTHIRKATRRIGTTVKKVTKKR